MIREMSGKIQKVRELVYSGKFSEHIKNVLVKLNFGIIVIIVVGFVSTYKDDQQTLQC